MLSPSSSHQEIPIHHPLFGIGGWLFWFFITVIIQTAIHAVVLLKGISEALDPNNSQYPGVFWLFVLFLPILMTSISAFELRALLSYKKSYRGRFNGRNVSIAYLVISLLSAPFIPEIYASILTMPDAYRSTPAGGAGITFIVCWIVYFVRSERVRITYVNGPSERKADAVGCPLNDNPTAQDPLQHSSAMEKVRPPSEPRDGEEPLLLSVLAKDSEGIATLQTRAEDSWYEQALDELEKGETIRGTWARALAEANGEEARAKAVYIRLRVKHFETKLGPHKP